MKVACEACGKMRKWKNCYGKPVTGLCFQCWSAKRAAEAKPRKVHGGNVSTIMAMPDALIEQQDDYYRTRMEKGSRRLLVAVVTALQARAAA